MRLYGSQPSIFWTKYHKDVMPENATATFPLSQPEKSATPEDRMEL